MRFTISRRLAVLVAAIPMTALLAGLTWANRLEPRVLGLPFLLSWIVGWVSATPLFLGAAYLLTREADEHQADGDGL